MPAADTPSTLPMFYEAPEALSKTTHAELGLKATNNYSFAAGANAIPLMIAEMPKAMRSYPIVFAGAGHLPMALTGLAQGENTFIDADGIWAEGHYIPAYVRRYPFVLAGGDADKRLTLCIDRAAPSLTSVDEDGTEPLFEDGDATDLTQNALKFCEDYQAMLNATKAIIAQLDQYDLLASQTSEITLPDRDTHTISGFMSIDEAKLSALEDAAFLELRKTGALAAIYCQLGSTNTWQYLLSRRSPTPPALQ